MRDAASRPARVLVADDEPVIRETVGFNLRREGLDVVFAEDGPSALQAVRDHHPDVVVLDIMMPGMDGFEVSRRVREESTVPILMLSARGEEIDRIVGLEMGADDYVVKPFSPKELVARVRALFRRLDRGPGDGPAEALRFGDLEVDTARHVVRWAGAGVRLTAKEFALLVALVEARGRVLSRQQLLVDVWGYSYAAGTRTVDVHVRRLREKIPGLAPSIVTVKSLGYRLARGPDA